ncbi:hypothetical protein Rs2_47962 [Raphanus sativus]|nr:hypothetical protein Rs2_47962 [Raphanus sativus]
MQATINAHRLSKFRKRLAAGTMYSIYGFDDTHHLSSFLQFLFRFVFDHFLIVYSLSHVAATLNAKVKENGEASPKPPHPDLKYLDQILTVPKRELFVEVDNDKEWLYGPLGVKLRKARTWYDDNGVSGNDMPGINTLPTKISVGVDENVKEPFAETTTGGPSDKNSVFNVFHSSKEATYINNL